MQSQKCAIEPQTVNRTRIPLLQIAMLSLPRRTQDSLFPRTFFRCPLIGWDRPHPTQLLLQAFTDHYYNLFDTNRSALAGLYQDQSLLTFEGVRFQGPQVGD